MNDTVENIFIQMFAPNEIPQAVVQLFDKTNFYLSRIDAPGMRPSQLCMIAAVATSNPGVSIQMPAEKLPDVIDTTEPIPAPETAVTGQTPPHPTPLAPGVPTGPMDAPATVLKAPKTALCLAMMTKDELREHAMQTWKYRLRNTYTKDVMIEKITARQNRKK